VNAASDTPFRVAVGGHRMTVTHTDGFPVDPVTVDALVIGMAERYDVLVTVGESGAIPLVAVAEAKGNEAMGVIRSGPGTAPPPGVRPAELTRRVLALSALRAAPAVRLPRGRPDRLYEVVLGGGGDDYVWTINGEPHGHDGAPLRVEEGERVRLAFENRTVMFHPMHLHGHTFQMVRAGVAGARKDTAIIRPDETVTVDFVADNPGQWMLHCHNLYHQEAGMMTTVSYVTDGA
ncbi:MAG TPA: multicopper oxidase domain-containing protein, partial [Acidimicrobiales bacterium]|nr:multicopper oxidase domain-containing protein [Acidimicrobiales bacterium]